MFSHVQLCNPMDCSPPGSSIHGILQARILEWGAVPFCGSSWPNGNSCVFNAWCIMDIRTNCWIQEWMNVDFDFYFFPNCLSLLSISYSTARFVFSIFERKMDVFAATLVLIINCFVWNLDDFTKDVLLEKCCLSLNDFQYSWQWKDVVAGSTGQWLGPLAVAEFGKESIILHPQSWLCPEIWGDVSDLSLLQSVQLQIVLPCNRTQWGSSSFSWSHDAMAIQVTYSQPRHCSPDMGTWDPRCLSPLTWTLPYSW